MEHEERVTTSPHLSKEEDGSQPSGETLLEQPGAQSGTCQVQRQLGVNVNDWQLRQSQRKVVQLEFQDSNLSPALPLLSVTSEVGHNFTEYSFSQQSNPDFAPLRAYPDVSVALERFGVPPQDCTSYSSEHSSLSQYPLTQATIPSEEKAGSCFTPSQHSLSSENKNKEKQMPHLSAITDNEQILSREGTGSSERKSETQTNPTDKHTRGVVDDEIFFLRKDVPAQHLLDLLQKEVGLRSSSSSAVSLESQASMKSTNESKITEVGKPVPDEILVKRDGPPGEATLFQKQAKQSDQSGGLSSEISNITMGSCSTQPDDSSELLHRQLLSEAQKLNRLEAETNKKQQIVLTPAHQLITSSLRNVTERKQSGKLNPGSLQWMGQFSPGAEWVHREQNLLSSQSKTGCDGSYLGFLPQSQSTPGVGIALLKPNVKAKLGQLSAIESEKENLYQSSTGITPQPADPNVDAHLPDEANQCDKDALKTSAEVQFLPSLNYIQKIDAWRAKQNYSPALEEFDGISSKNKSHDAASNPLNPIFAPAGTLRRPSVTGAANQNSTQTSSSAPSGSSSPRREEAVGGAPCDNDNRGSAAPPSPFGRSQSHSSLSTVFMSINEHQQTDAPPEIEWTQSQDDAPHHHCSSTAVQPSPVMNLGHFSDVSFDQTLSSSQDSYSEVRVVASVETSSVVSLELDNYAPYWTSKQSTPPPPPKSQVLNIDEQIPLYLQNLGIDQTPSKILTSFAPRGPIREPEFSPTDLITIKGSTGTPSRSTRPPEGSSPHKEEFSRCSILSVGSSVSLPFSLDSLGPTVSVPEQVRARMTSLSEIEAIQSESRLAPGSQPKEGLQFSLQPSQQRRDGRPAVSQLPNCSDSDTSLTLKAKIVRSNSNSPFQSSQNVDQDAENSFVNTSAVLEIRKLLSHAGNMSTGSSAASSAALPNQLFSHEDVFKSIHPKTSRNQDYLFPSSSTDGDPRTRSSLLWTRSSSDSMLALEKTRQTSVGRESMTSQQPENNPTTHSATTMPPATVLYNIAQERPVGRSVETSLAISKSARRTEPEGCSSVPPDNIPTQPQVRKALPAASTQHLNSTSSDRVSEEEESLALLASQSPSSSSIVEDADQKAMSEGSSESSLAVRVAKLLRSDSPATMMSSMPSVTDQEENKTKEWLKLNALRQQGELQELNVEDRKRIDEIKKELLLRNPIKSQGSTETESSASSILQINEELNPPQSVKMFFPLADVANQHRLSMKHPESHTQLQSTHRPDLEALVCEIAAREGVTLSTKQPRTFTPVTTSTRRRSTSSSPSSSFAPPLSPAPHPLQLTELSTGPGRPIYPNQPVPPHMDEDEAALARTTNREQPSVYEASNSFHSRDQNGTFQSNTKNQKRQDSVVGQSEELPPPTQDFDQTDGGVRPDSTQSYSHYEELSNRTSCVLGVGQKPTQAAGPGSTATPDQVSNVHLTLYPKVANHTSTSAAQCVGAASGLPLQIFATPRDPVLAASSPDDGVGSSSLPEWYQSREPERSETVSMFQTVVAQRGPTAASTQSFIPQHQTEAAAGETPAPVLLPYKPRGSEELFYVPQTKADVSSAEHSDTTMESSHTGSDDALPPHFSSDVLGNKDPGLDRGVSFRHAEGIYSKRLKAVAFKMQSPEDRVDAAAATDRVFPAAIQTLKPFTSFTGAPSLNHNISTRDQGTSPVQYLQYKPPETSHERFHRVHVETVQASVSQGRGERDLSQLDPQQSSSTLDHLWQKFCNQWTAEVSRPNRDREALLLKRLERLSRLIHPTKTDIQEGQDSQGEEQLRRIQRNREAHQEVRRHFTEAEGKVRGGGKPHVQRRLQVGEAVQARENDGHASICSHSSSQTLHFSPVVREESETSSLASGSMSTVDTARLIRAFGPHRVQHLTSSSSLSKLYSTINKQQEESEGNSDELDVTPPGTTGTDESVAADSASSSTVPSHRGPSRALTAKSRVKLLSKSVQTGDLEILSNGTRRHTRDVGTTFPSPGEARASSNMVRGRKGRKSPSKAYSIQKQRKNKRSPSKLYPKGVSWFISADSLRSETRKENRPAESSACWSTAWFEPYSRVSPWRAPLTQKQVHQDRDDQSCKDQPDPDPPKTRTVFPSLTRISLQESLEMHRPEFISQSRQRVMRLALQVEERRHQAGFNRDRNLFFNQRGRPTRLPKPAGTALLKRAVPRKEMIQRSKQIYESLPEVQQRREEERRKAEYQSYRLNAQLYNKRITNRVLGRRAAWH